MTTSTIISEIDAFVSSQNINRGKALAGGGTLALDYDALTGTVPTGGNAVTGISGIASGVAAITLPSGQFGNTVIMDGGISTTPSSSGADSYSFWVDTNGVITETDNNTGHSITISNASYLIFNGAATNSAGAFQSAYLIEVGANAQLASMYNAAFQRIPDLPGLEFYLQQWGTPALPNLHQAATYFLASDEFKAKYPALLAPADGGGPHDQAFINQLYGGILHRTPTASETNFYVQALQGTLTSSNGQAIPACDRAQLLVYFSLSPENQSDIATSSGGWLINPANGATNLGVLTAQAASAVLTSEIAAGIINASAFDNLSPSSTAGGGGITDAVNVDGVSADGPTSTVNGATGGGGEIGTGSSAPANLTLNLDTIYYKASIGSVNVTVNGVSTGGSVIYTADFGPLQSSMNDGGTVNLFGNNNSIFSGGVVNGGVSVATVVKGWNSTDVMTHGANNGKGVPVGGGAVYQGTASNPVSGAQLASNLQNFHIIAVAVNVGPVADDSVTTMVAAANQVYKVGNVDREAVYFFGQDPSGNTMIYYWMGDPSHSHTVLAGNISGAVELVGVQASSLTSANFHD